MQELFDVALVSDSRRHKADDTYVEFDEALFKNIPVPLELGDFESVSQPGRHDGTRVVDAVLRLYDDATTLT
jgi:hypothetical protein